MLKTVLSTKNSEKRKISFAFFRSKLFSSPMLCLILTTVLRMILALSLGFLENTPKHWHLSETGELEWVGQWHSLPTTRQGQCSPIKSILHPFSSFTISDFQATLPATATKLYHNVLIVHLWAFKHVKVGFGFLYILYLLIYKCIYLISTEDSIDTRMIIECSTCTFICAEYVCMCMCVHEYTHTYSACICKNPKFTSSGPVGPI